MDKARDLISNVVHALKFSPPNYLRSITGLPRTWHADAIPHTETNALSLQQPLPSLDTLRRALLPAWPGYPDWIPESTLKQWLFRESSVGLYPQQNITPTPWPNESWLFMNGICTDLRIADVNAEALLALFGCPLTLLHNQTHGFALDLAECALGKGWLAATEAARRLFPAFYSELKRPDIDRVVLIAHSQGTILSAVFIALLQKLLGQPLPDQPESNQADKLLRGQPAAASNKALWCLQPADGASGARIVPVEGEANLPSHLWFDWWSEAELALPPLTVAEVRKLEVYCFATCATTLPYLVPASDLHPPAPYYEHFGNERDLVARMGLFPPQRGAGVTQIEGTRFIRAGGWGHLLNAHYLDLLAEQWQQGQPAPFTSTDPNIKTSRLMGDYERNRAFASAAMG